MDIQRIALIAGDVVVHDRYGVGTVEFPKEGTAIVRFEHGLEECEIKTIRKQSSLRESIIRQQWHPLLQVVTKSQAAAIQSVNDAWGVFSRSRISLLPHQLWVCHQVLRRWPIRYLVADDVGLGKTIEAGLILWPLLSKGLVRRLLVLCPASLVEQWQFRLRDMFDIRLASYSTQADTVKGDFWNTHNQVVASLPTLRADRRGRHERLLEAEPWDLVIVDEAHHLNSDERSGATLGYKLVESLLGNRKVDSCIFFTGTPHRGKSYGFWSLLKLLRPDLFDPKEPDYGQTAHLREVFIRNNKSLVTDMKGNKLFKPVKVYPETYSYTQEEEAFYDQLTKFIAGGKAYASSLSAQEGKQVMLVLIAMQKLASSSVAAICKAMRGRLDRLNATRDDLLNKIKLSTEDRAAFSAGAEDTAILLDGQDTIDVQLAKATVTLMEQEIPNLQALINLAEAVGVETKISKIMDVLDSRYKGRHVLFFTEYKATQALLITSLMKKYGEGSVTFINGDERLEALELPDGQFVNRSIIRSDAADLFNEGKVKFLVSTEAGGEGIDLQEQCNSLIHVDLPWNPMRLHQRVGRLNRYGQKKPVEVITIRNPATVESRIWDKLNAKLERIMETIGSAMDDPEDLLQLVLGMSSASVFTEMFSGGQLVGKERLDDWFDQNSKTFGGESVIDTVKSLVGNANHFDLSALKEIPNIDLPELRPFFENMLILNRRRVVKEGNQISFKTPDDWLDEPGIRRKYDDLVFSRNVIGKSAAEKVIGVGHKVFDKALQNALNSPVSLGYSEGIVDSLVIYQVYDRITDQSGHMRQAVVAIKCKHGEPLHKWEVLRDWSALKILNGIKVKNSSLPESAIDKDMFERLVENANSLVEKEIKDLDLPFKIPEYRAIAMIMAANK